ncbi:MAG: leucine-rich repeat protein [Treponema sp.]|jgi:hypothetical protein|nr:leucine-rich repeat protein [Treponema sp.]
MINKTILTLILLIGLLFTGCPDFGYSIYYNGNGNDEGYAPKDSNTYYLGDTAIILGPGTLKKQGATFQGWRTSGIDRLYQEGELITVEMDTTFYAQWSDQSSFFRYTTEQDGLTITGFIQALPWMDRMVVPSEIAGKPVIRIGDNAFKGLYLGEVRLPEGLISIGNNAFSQNWLSQIRIPDTVTHIGSIAFQNNNLQSITLGRMLTSIGDYAFDGNYITELDIPPHITTINSGAFNDNALTRITIGRDVTIASDSSLGRYGASFRNYYNKDKAKKAGAYVYFEKDSSWKEVLD